TDAAISSSACASLWRRFCKSARMEQTMQRGWINFAGAMCLIGLASVVAVVLLPGSRERQPSPPTGLPWGNGCNDILLSTTFALDKAPDFVLTQPQRARIDAVVSELRRGYGGTLVVAPHDDVLDSAAFLAHYLRAFALPDPGIFIYDYRFERILARLSGAPEVLADSR